MWYCLVIGYVSDYFFFEGGGGFFFLGGVVVGCEDNFKVPVQKHFKRNIKLTKYCSV